MWNTRLGLVLLLLVSCGESTSEPDDVPEIEGNFSFSEIREDHEREVRCSSQGLLTFTQGEASIRGTLTQVGTCTGPDSLWFETSGASPVTSGQLERGRIRFQAPFCEYDGTASGEPISKLVGTSRCTMVAAGVTMELIGKWQAGR